MSDQKDPVPGYEKYRGLRALEFLRVSTPEQEKHFGWPRQHAELAKKMITPLDLRMVGTVKDSYTGLEFEMHDALEEILRRAKDGDFDILIMDMLDRLGRKGLEREIYMLELKQTGVRVVSADPNDHSDDDSLWGEVIRYLKGKASEEEIRITKHRTEGGRRTKATGDPEKGIPPKIVGNGQRPYGYKYILDGKGKRVGLELNHDIILVEENSTTKWTEEDGTTKWTEVRVVIFIYESLAEGISARAIVKILNEKGVPNPNVAKSIKSRRMKKDAGWSPIAISRIAKRPAYSTGEYSQFNTISLERVPGKRYTPRAKAPEGHQVIIPVPTIVSRELAERARRRLSQNKPLAKRNNRNPEASLLRGGIAKCGYCGCSLHVYTKTEIHNGIEKCYLSYNCNKPYNAVGRCPGCNIAVHVLDEAATNKLIELLRDPKEIDNWVKSLRKADPTKDRRKTLKEELDKVQEDQAAMRENLAVLMKQRKPDQGTIAYLNGQLQGLAEKEEGLKRMLDRGKDEHEKWKEVQKKLDELHQICNEESEKIGDPNYEISYKRKLELLLFFGIQITVWKKEHKPRYQIQCKPPDIVKLLSWTA